MELSQLTTGANALVDGQPADVLFAGLAPGLPMGVYQINVRIPAEAAPGQAPVRIMAGESSTQDAVTVFVK